MKNLTTIVLAFLMAGVSLVATAGETSGSAELGYLARSGNTDSSDLNAKFQLAHAYDHWAQSFHVAVEQSEENDQRTAKRFLAGVKSEYRLSDSDYVFATVDYESDDFGAYRSRWTETLGYGRRLISEERQTLDLELGAGARQATLQTREEQSDIIARLGLNYLYTFATSADFSNKLLIETGADNTYAQNETAVRMPLLENVSLKVAYTLRHNTDVAAGTEKTDTLTSVNVAYSF
jgi:putative salt-induced outer membrane protein